MNTLLNIRKATAIIFTSGSAFLGTTLSPNLYAQNQNQKQNPGSQMQQQEQKRQKMRQVSGELIGVKEVGIKGSEDKNYLVLIKTNKANQRLILDLGPIENMKKRDLKKGKSLAAEGPVVEIGGRQILVAKRVKVGDQIIQVNRAKQERSAQNSQQTQMTKSQGQREQGQKQQGQASEQKERIGIFVFPVNLRSGRIDEIITEEDQIKENPSNYVGKTVLLRGEINHVYGKNAFTVDYDGLIGGDEILVYNATDSLQEGAEEGSNIQIKGIIRRADLKTFEKEYGIDLDDDKFDEFENGQMPYIIATQIY